MKKTLLTRTCRFAVGFLLFAWGQVALADDLVWIGAADGNFSTPSNWAGGTFPDPQFVGDSLKFNTAGVTVTNDYDPGVSGTLELGLGTGTNTTSGNFHFQSGAGNFTFDGFGLLAGPSSQHSTLVRADAGAGMTQTFNLDLDFNAGVHERRIAMNNSDNTDRTDPNTVGKVVFNGNLDFRSNQIFVSENRAYIVLNGTNTGNGRGSVTSGTNTVNSPVRINGEAADATLGTVIELGTNSALGNPSAGTWATGDLNMRGIQAIAPTYVTTSAALDLSEYAFQLQSGGGPVGGSVNYRSAFDTTIGWVFNMLGNRDMVVSDAGKLTVAHGIFLSTDTTARQLNIKTPGTSGSNGELVIDGPLYNTYVDPITSAANGLTATGGIATQRGAADGATQVNGTIRVNNGTFRLNADSGATWIGSEFRALNASTIFLGHDNALGDSTSIVSLEGNSTIDIGSNTISQKFTNTSGTLRGTGTLTHPDWDNIVGTVQPGGATPTAADSLTFDFTADSAGNLVLFQTASSLNFALDAGNASSSINVLGSSGGTTVALDNNKLNFTDLSGGNLAVGDYVLFDGDANTTFNVGVGINLMGLSGFSGSLGVTGDDLVLSLSAGGLAGDFDNDNDVDGADFLLWQRNPGVGNLSDWQGNYGAPLVAAVTSVPEPTAVLLLCSGVVLLGVRRW